MAKLKKQDHDLRTSSEVQRLGKNWKALLDMLPEMVFLIREDLIIEYQNQYAIKKVGDLCGKTCTEFLCNQDKRCQENCPVKAVVFGAGGTSGEDLVEARVGDIAVEYNYQPFQGYSEEKLVMILMRDITERKAHEREIEIFNNNVENILRRKIDELKESETTRRRLARQVNVLKKKVEQNKPGDDIIGSSKKIQVLKDVITQVADSDATILITGESGTGKELVANMVRNLSRRKDKLFLKVNCSSIHENLLESDLFGYEKGAFTGAAARRKGKFEIADGGTIFLDEIGDISPKMQATLLRVLQNGEVIRVGGTSSIKVDVRVLAATNTDLAQAVKDGSFRLDLYYRLNIITIALPPLRERKEDIVELTSHFVRLYQKAFKKKSTNFLPSTIIDKLLAHHWPGNVRELENVLQRAVLLQNILRNKRNLTSLCLQHCTFNDREAIHGAIISTLSRPDSVLRCFEVQGLFNFEGGLTTLLRAIESSKVERLTIGPFETRQQLQTLTQCIPSLRIRELQLQITVRHLDVETAKQDLLLAVKNNFRLRLVKGEIEDDGSDLFESARDKQRLAFYTNRNECLDQWVDNPERADRKVWPDALALAEKAGPDSLFRGLRSLLGSDSASKPNGRKRKRPQYYTP